MRLSFGELYTDCDVGCVVGDRVRTGANVTLAPGSRIGPEATIAHGATVVGDVSGGCEVIQ